MTCCEYFEVPDLGEPFVTFSQRVFHTNLSCSKYSLEGGDHARFRVFAQPILAHFTAVVDGLLCVTVLVV